LKNELIGSVMAEHLPSM